LLGLSLLAPLLVLLLNLLSVIIRLLRLLLVLFLFVTAAAISLRCGIRVHAEKKGRRQERGR